MAKHGQIWPEWTLYNLIFILCTFDCIQFGTTFIRLQPKTWDCQLMLLTAICLSGSLVILWSFFFTKTTVVFLRGALSCPCMEGRMYWHSRCRFSPTAVCFALPVLASGSLLALFVSACFNTFLTFAFGDLSIFSCTILSSFYKAFYFQANNSLDSWSGFSAVSCHFLTLAWMKQWLLCFVLVCVSPPI